jgi:hypothetical protein
VGQNSQSSKNGIPARGGRAKPGGRLTLRQITHDLANHVLAMELRIQELLADRVCMGAQPDTIHTLERLSLDAASSLKDLQSAVLQIDPRGGDGVARPRSKKRP